MQNLPLEVQQQLQTLCDIVMKYYLDKSITEDRAREQTKQLIKGIRKE
jgi:hypothetical protein